MNKLDITKLKTKKNLAIALIASALLLVGVLVIKNNNKNNANSGANAEEKIAGETIEKMFKAKIVGFKHLSKGSDGLVAWVIQNDSGVNVVYTSGSKTDVIAFGGAAIDSDSKENLTIKIMKPLAEKISQNNAGSASSDSTEGQSAASTQPTGTPYMVGDFNGKIPDSIQAISKLKGITVGKAPIEKTLFVVFDPRCPYCKRLYQQQQKYIDKGFAFKWIPTMALGQDAIVANQIETVLSAKDPVAEFKAMMEGNPNPTQINASQGTLITLAENQSFLSNVFKVNGGKAGVPTGFFIDHRTNEPRMMQGVSEPVILNNIFGE